MHGFVTHQPPRFPECCGCNRRQHQHVGGRVERRQLVSRDAPEPSDAVAGDRDGPVADEGERRLGRERRPSPRIEQDFDPLLADEAADVERDERAGGRADPLARGGALGVRDLAAEHCDPGQRESRIADGEPGDGHRHSRSRINQLDPREGQQQDAGGPHPKRNRDSNKEHDLHLLASAAHFIAK